jgi:lauroyl/myristoyl acyltransferase
MTAPVSSPPARGILFRVVDEVLYRALAGFTAIVRALPSRWVLRASDVLGLVIYLVDRRGRRAGRQNLRAVFGDALTAAERQRVLVASFRSNIRSVLLMLHISPLTPERYLRWVDVPPEVEQRLRASADATTGGGVLVSGHIGNWELLLGLPNLYEGFPRMGFMAEGLEFPAMDRFAADLRGTGGAFSVQREGGARALVSHVRRGGAAALLADRNVRGSHGGIWAPFLGLMARTTPLPGWLAARVGVHVRPVFCLPNGDGRYRVWLGPNLAEGVDLSDRKAATLEITCRINAVLEKVIRAQPEAWNWTLKRFKSRPERELGAYPPYSLWDADGVHMQ